MQCYITCKIYENKGFTSCQKTLEVSNQWLLFCTENGHLCRAQEGVQLWANLGPFHDACWSIKKPIRGRWDFIVFIFIIATIYYGGQMFVMIGGEQIMVEIAMVIWSILTLQPCINDTVFPCVVLISTKCLQYSRIVWYTHNYLLIKRCICWKQTYEYKMSAK